MRDTGIIIQARINSKRFPRKVFADLKGKTVLQHVISRAREVWPNVILAVPSDDYHEFRPAPIEIPTFPSQIIRVPDYTICCGPEDDVLERFWWAAKSNGLQTIIRITADCPMLNVDKCKQLHELFLEGGCSYAAIDWPKGGFPKGWGCEIFDFFTLELARTQAKTKYDREHVTPWMRKHVRCKFLQNDKDESHLNYCVDTPADLKRLEKL